MIFTGPMLDAVLAGTKTVTRRRADGPATACHYEPGKTYAIQPGRGEHAVARLEVVAASHERLGAITSAEARAEGFPGRDEFFAYWRRLHGYLDGTAWVHRIEFRLCIPANYHCPDCGAPTEQQVGRPGRCGDCLAVPA